MLTRKNYYVGFVLTVVVIANGAGRKRCNGLFRHRFLVVNTGAANALSVGNSVRTLYSCKVPLQKV